MEDIEIVRIRIPECGVFSFDAGDLDLHINDFCVVSDLEDADNLSLGQVLCKIQIKRQKFPKSIQKVLRKASDEDVKQFDENARKEIEAYDICREKIKDRQMPMKLVKCRYAFDRSKVTFYFTADRRIDFRDLVKDLAYIFKRRIELRQIGVRDEAKMIGGYGCCGLQLCCTTFLKKLGRLNIKMAKEQNMTLTPSKISGICGRLLCCLQYENEWYQKIKEIMPDIGSSVETGEINGKVEDIDPFLNIIKVRDDNGNLVDVKLEDVNKKSSGKKWKKGKEKSKAKSESASG